ncbi:hypothetical protein GYMLUDRAFT_62923 [Collybiopsis luxurians FD-317 M1]|uniref:DUF6534 domain-containing protein n=1 Tax=Collybiopsis luxurians FD-317 M1 TaxID=944289 RepID=A0A0D0AWB9_9AGAR|nr:hypothetical protein GYMLUDRAFT_62923 [Collybiopsis luxurians FD-317 M1]
MSSDSNATCTVPSVLLDLSLNDTLGAVFIGHSFSCAVLGVLTCQVFNYYQQYSADSLGLKTLVSCVATHVGVLWSLETLQVILISHSVYHYTVSGINRLFGSYLAIITEPVVWSLPTQVLVAALSGSIAKIALNKVYVVLISKFLQADANPECKVSHHNKFITGIIVMIFTAKWIIVVLQFGWIVAYAAGAYHLESILDFLDLKIQASIALALGALAEVLIALALIFYLRRMRTGYREPDSLVQNLTTYAIHSGALTSSLSILTLIFVRLGAFLCSPNTYAEDCRDIQYNARPKTFDYMAVYFVLSKSPAANDDQTDSGSARIDTPLNIWGAGTFQEGSLHVRNQLQPYSLAEARLSTSKSSGKVAATSFRPKSSLQEN